MYQTNFFEKHIPYY